MPNLQQHIIFHLKGLLGAWSLVLGSWSLLPVPWFIVLGSWSLRASTAGGNLGSERRISTSKAAATPQEFIAVVKVRTPLAKPYLGNEKRGSLTPWPLWSASLDRSQQGLLATYLIPGCVGRGVKLGSENSSGGAAAGAGGVWKSGDLEIQQFGIQQNTKNENYQNPNPFCPKCRQGLD